MFDEKLGCLPGEFAQEFLLVHPVLEGFAPVDEDDRNLVIVETAKFRVGVDIDLPPVETATFVQLRQALLDDFAQVAPATGIHDDFTGIGHGR